MQAPLFSTDLVCTSTTAEATRPSAPAGVALDGTPFHGLIPGITDMARTTRGRYPLWP